MMYSHEGKLYTPEQIEGKTFSEGSKPEPIFSLDEMNKAYFEGALDEKFNCLSDDNFANYIHHTYNITL